MSSSRRGPDISAAQVAGSALAAVSAAVVASFLGVGGTIIGAALGSIVASVGGAFYSHSFQRAGYRLGETKVVTVVTRQHPEPEHTSNPDHPGRPGPSDLPAPGSRVPRWLSWKAAVALTVVAFVVAMAAIAITELVLGRPISGGSGGTTISHLVQPKSKTSTPKPTPTPTPNPSATTTPGPTATAPTSGPTSPPTSPTAPTPTDSSTTPGSTSTTPSPPTTTAAG